MGKMVLVKIGDGGAFWHVIINTVLKNYRAYRNDQINNELCTGCP
jgi:hypothetical protein